LWLQITFNVLKQYDKNLEGIGKAYKGVVLGGMLRHENRRMLCFGILIVKRKELNIRG